MPVHPQARDDGLSRSLITYEANNVASQVAAQVFDEEKVQCECCGHYFIHSSIHSFVH